jgi:predicted nucleic acid-binding protein
MARKFLVDTNVLVYSYDSTDRIKQHSSTALLSLLVQTGQGVLSSQVLSEFFWTVTRKLRPAFPSDTARERVINLTLAWEVLAVSPAVIAEAARGVHEYQLSLWDAQIWAVARLNAIPYVFSEDFNSGSTLEGVQFINPFVSDFPIEKWLQSPHRKRIQ